MSDLFHIVRIISKPTLTGPTQIFLDGLEIKGLRDYSFDHRFPGPKSLTLTILVEDLVIEKPARQK
jgi:hypothetical protein